MGFLKAFCVESLQVFCACGGGRVLRMTVQRMPRPSPSPALKEFLLIKVERAAFVLEALSFPTHFGQGIVHCPQSASEDSEPFEEKKVKMQQIIEYASADM